MTNVNPFTQQELDLLCDAPVALGSAAIASDMSGLLSAAKEMIALTKAVASGASTYPTNQLIKQVHSKLHSQEAIKARMERKQSQQKEKTSDPAAALEAAYALARAVHDILTTKVQLQEASEYRQWVVAIAQATAEAAKEGGFLGIGGTRVSKDEQNYLDTLTGALQGR